jgi:hypothetical protein
MTAICCCSVEMLPERLDDQQRRARTVVGLISLGAAVRSARQPGTLWTLGAVGAGWFGASHLVAARTGYAGCPELGAIPSVILRREVQIGCVPWQIADRRLGFAT